MNYIIDFIQTATTEDIDAYLVEHKCTVINEYDHFEKVFLVSADEAPVKTDLVESIVNDNDTVIQLLGSVTANNYAAQPNPDMEAITISTESDADWWKNYVLLTPNFESPTVTLSRKGALARVYIMDSGIDASHPEFAEANITNLFSFTGEYEDTNGHGTALASLVCGKTCGLSAASVQVVKVFDAVQETRQSDFLNALDAIMTDFINNSNGLGILNLSWTIDKNQYIESKIQTLIDAGVYVVVAAGNSGVPIENVTPASMSGVLTIGAFDKDLNPSNFSNYSNSEISVTQNETNSGELDGWAPGEEIAVALPGGGYGFAAGTSVAAAIHSCALAYNFDEYFYKNELLVTARQRDLTYISGMSLGHKDLLHLSDPKYANSVNRFTTVLNEKEFDHFVQPTEVEQLFTVGKPFMISIFNPQKTKTVDYDMLPEGFVITSNGLLVGDAVLAEGVTHELHEVNLLVTGLDDSVTEMHIKIGIVASDFDPADVPEDDPFIKPTLAEESCRDGGCRDDCEYYLGGYSICISQDIGKGMYNCYCS